MTNLIQNESDMKRHETVMKRSEMVTTRFNLQNNRNMTNLLIELIQHITHSLVHIHILAVINCYTCILIHIILLQIIHQ